MFSQETPVSTLRKDRLEAYFVSLGLFESEMALPRAHHPSQIGCEQLFHPLLHNL